MDKMPKCNFCDAKGKNVIHGEFLCDRHLECEYPTNTTKRQQLSQQDLDNALDGVQGKLAYRSGQKGMGTMASNHEILGIIVQETSEYEEAIHLRMADDAKVEELKDIAVACLFGIASIESGGIDW